MRVTIREVGARAGVSMNTVSRVLNGKGDVSQETRRRVEAAIADLGYTPNAIARALVARQTRTIGHLVADVTNPHNVAQTRTVQDLSRQRGYAVILVDTDEDAERQADAVRLLVENRVDGVLVQPVEGSGADLRRLVDWRVPFVLFHREVPGLVADTVMPDNVFGAYQAVDHLLGLGRRRIAYLTSRYDLSPVRERVEGYRRALVKHDLAYDERYVVRGAMTVEGGYEMAHEALALNPPPDAVFAYNDLVAIGCLRAFRETGLRVPDDVALVGFDDIALAAFVEVPLTTVAQPTQEIGETATNLLLNRIESDVRHPPVRVVLPPRLVVRASSGAPTALDGQGLAVAATIAAASHQ